MRILQIFQSFYDTNMVSDLVIGRSVIVIDLSWLTYKLVDLTQGTGFNY